jgi:hypothetical protein
LYAPLAALTGMGAGNACTSDAIAGGSCKKDLFSVEAPTPPAKPISQKYLGFRLIRDWVAGMALVSLDAAGAVNE